MALIIIHFIFVVKIWQPAQHLHLLLSLKSSLESELIKITLNSDTILRITVDPSPCLAYAVSCASSWCFPLWLGSSVFWVMVTKCFRKLQFGNGDYKWDCRGWWRGPSQGDLVVLLEQQRGGRVGTTRRGWRQRAAKWQQKGKWRWEATEAAWRGVLQGIVGILVDRGGL